MNSVKVDDFEDEEADDSTQVLTIHVESGRVEVKPRFRVSTINDESVNLVVGGGK